jgi:hypothetical protein
MKHSVQCLLAAVLLAGLGACATLPQPLSVDEAVAMAKQGETPDAIIARMRASKTSYVLSASDIVRLKEAGLPLAVLDYMQQTQIEAAKDEERRDLWRRAPGPLYCHPFWGCRWR